jgi:hypothetical protein
MAAAGLGACLGPAASEQSGEPTLADPPWLSCWQEAASEPDWLRLVCRHEPRAVDGPWAVGRMAVQWRSARGEGLSETITLHVGEPLELTRYSIADLPIDLSLGAVMTATPGGLSWWTGRVRTVRARLASADQALATAPIVLGPPTDGWRIEVQADGDDWTATLDPFEVQVVAGYTETVAPTMQISTAGTTLAMTIAVPPGATQVSGKSTLGAGPAVAFVLDGPGSYRAGAAGISRVPPVAPTPP